MEKTNSREIIWTENDFEKMQWHDCKIYAMAFDGEKFELIFDIDYIVEWVTLNEGETSFKFWVSPATLVFRNVYDIHIALYSVDFQIQNVRRANPSKPKNSSHIPDVFEYDWTLETTNGDMVFKSVGYNQYARREPVLLASQTIDLPDRGGISFDRTTYSK